MKNVKIFSAHTFVKNGSFTEMSNTVFLNDTRLIFHIDECILPMKMCNFCVMLWSVYIVTFDTQWRLLRMRVAGCQHWTLEFVSVTGPSLSLTKFSHTVTQPRSVFLSVWRQVVWSLHDAELVVLLSGILCRCRQVYRRMMRCCSELGCHTQVALSFMNLLLCYTLCTCMLKQN